MIFNNMLECMFTFLLLAAKFYKFCSKYFIFNALIFLFENLLTAIILTERDQFDVLVKISDDSYRIKKIAGAYCVQIGLFETSLAFQFQIYLQHTFNSKLKRP